MARRYDAVVFDLLTALIDSWSLWARIAGGQDAGRRWRGEYLKLTYGAGAYRPYEALVAQAAAAAGLDPRLAEALAARWGELEPWPEAANILSALDASGVALGVVTNCSRSLGRSAAQRVGVAFAQVVTAEEVGWYKPDPRPYRLAMERLGVAPDRCLFVAGSAYDLIGAARVELPVFWHDRIGMSPPHGAPAARARARTLEGLPAFCGVAEPRA